MHPFLAYPMEGERIGGKIEIGFKFNVRSTLFTSQKFRIRLTRVYTVGMYLGMYLGVYLHDVLD